MGADNYVASKDEKSMADAAGSLDLILNTVSANHQASMYFPLLARKGKEIMIGAALGPHEVSAFDLLMKSVGLAGSMIGTLADTQEVIDFCAKNNIQPNVELITADKLDEVYKELLEGNDRVIRYVIDMDKSLAQ